MTETQVKSLRARLLFVGLSNVFIGDLPSLKLQCVALKLTTGYPNTRYFGAMDLEEPLVEVIIRTRDYGVGESQYTVVKDALDRYADESTGIISCWVTGSPGYLGRDINGFCEWHMLFHVTTI